MNSIPDFKLRAFYAAAKNTSFTKAAQELCVTQPAITRHIRNLEEHYGVLLFERQGSKNELTTAGRVMLTHVEQLLVDYQNLQYAMYRFSNQYVGQLRLGASTTISQYVLPPYLASFISEFPHADISMINGNSRDVEAALNEHNIDLGLIEGITRQPTLSYTQFMEDELVILAGAQSQIARKPELSRDEFKTIPLVMRERGSGTLDAIEQDLLRQNIRITDLNICIYLGSTEAIKLFMQNSESIGILSRTAVQKELQSGLLVEIKVPGLLFKRKFCFVQAPGPQNPLTARFMDFVTQSIPASAALPPASS